MSRVLLGAGLAAIAAGVVMAVPRQHSTPRIEVVVAGDSFSSGEGNPPFTGGRCHRSQQAWSHFLFRGRGGINSLNVACSGAKIDDLYRTFKGEPSQIEVVRQKQPIYITLTIGGNDVGFGRMLLECFLWECLSDSQYSAAQENIRALEPRLVRVYSAFRQAAPRAIFTPLHYFRIFPEGRTMRCGWLSRREQVRLNALTDLLNEVISQAAVVSMHNAPPPRLGTYISTDSALEGHELCTNDSWVFPVGNLPHKEYDGHPTLKGQMAIAGLVTPAMIYD